MNSIASRLIGYLIIFGALIGILLLVFVPIKNRQDAKLISGAVRELGEERSLRETQIITLEERQSKLENGKAALADYRSKMAALNQEKLEIEAAIITATQQRDALIVAMNAAAVRARGDYKGRSFEAFEPGNGRTYKNVEVKKVDGEGVQMQSEFGLLKVRGEDMSEPFRRRFRFGMVPGDPAPPAVDEEDA